MTKHDNVSQGKIMKATEFVKKFGWDEAEKLIRRFPEWADGYCKIDDEFLNYSDAQDGYTLADCEHCVEFLDLNRLVESHELVESIGGLPAAKAHLNSVAERCVNGGLEAVREQYKILKQAIADVEACQ